MSAGRKIVDFPAIQAIANAHLDAVEPIKDIELGERNPVNAARPDGLPHKYRVEPPATPPPPCDRPELISAIPDQLTDLIVLLGRERAVADPRRVGLANAEHVTDRVGPQPRADRSLCRNRVRGRHERISAVIHIEQGALRALEQNSFSLAPLLVEQRPNRIHERQYLWRYCCQLID